MEMLQGSVRCGRGSARIAEAKAMFISLHIAVTHGWSHFIFKGDAQLISHLLGLVSDIHWDVLALLEDSRELWSYFPSALAQAIRRTTNGAAHKLTKRVHAWQKSCRPGPYSRRPLSYPFDPGIRNISAGPYCGNLFVDAPGDGDGEEEDYTTRNQIRTPVIDSTHLPDHTRREILELGLPDDGYNYLLHLREIKNTGGGFSYYHNSKAKHDQLPHDVKVYDASRVRISEVDGDSNEKAIYIMASKTVGVRIQKAVDPELAALLDDSDLSRFGSDDEDLDEDFVVRANLPEEGGGAMVDEKINLEQSEVSKREHNESDNYGPQEHEMAFIGGDESRNYLLEEGDECVTEKSKSSSSFR
ncbi:hypothetical protein HHK36_003035 [Tetracentron sinense]|uniref:RNase H type-1 domain-containing protein n=1 Tax=Tetracentron sinense TaxID=13715 RepID=A0A834ZRP1_TETSI|nr:hypothetical protein HHK36_003035 [Tetracentron sinense]